MSMEIIIKDLSHAYGHTLVLDQINLTVHAGEHIGVVGVSGGGKSTLLKLISGLYQVQNGVIRVCDAANAEDRRKNVAMVMQSAGLFPTSIRDNITCGHVMDEEHILRACEAAQLTQWLATLPDGLNTHVGERNAKVSGGQAQRIAIARAIAKDAPVILLDEPTSALDKETGSAVIKAMEGLTKGKTVLHVSHRPETLNGCDRILQLSGGQLYAP